MLIKIEGDISSAFVLHCLAEGKEVHCFEGFIETNNKEVLKEKVKQEEGFMIAKNHDKSFKDYTTSTESKDKKKIYES